MLLYGESDGPTIAQKFATHFQVSSNLTTDCSHHNNNNAESLSELHRYLSTANADDFSLLDVESVSKCMLQMAKGKAPGSDGIQVEHLQYAHPIVCLLYTSPSPRDRQKSRMPSSA